MAPEAESKARKARTEHLGDFERVHHDYTYAQLWTIQVDDAWRTPAKGRQLTKGPELHVNGGLAWSPDAARIAFAATATPDLIDTATSDIYTLTLASGQVEKIVGLPGPDAGPRWSPDGAQIAFRSAMGREDFFHANARIAVVAADGGTPRSITDAFDEDAEPHRLDSGGDFLHRRTEDGQPRVQGRPRRKNHQQGVGPRCAHGDGGLAHPGWRPAGVCRRIANRAWAKCSCRRRRPLRRACSPA